MPIAAAQLDTAASPHRRHAAERGDRPPMLAAREGDACDTGLTHDRPEAKQGRRGPLRRRLRHGTARPAQTDAEAGGPGAPA